MRSDRDFLAFLKDFLRGKRLAMLLLVVLVIIGVTVIGNRDYTEANINETEPSDEGAELERLLSKIDGVGECHVTVVLDGEEDATRVYSVAVVCDGGDSVRVRAAVTELVTSLYGIGANRVSIFKLR